MIHEILSLESPVEISGYPLGKNAIFQSFCTCNRGNGSVYSTCKHACVSPLVVPAIVDGPGLVYMLSTHRPITYRRGWRFK